jgi:hypothetical protein
MNQLPMWAAWLQLIATVSIAGFAGFIGYRQWRTAYERVLLDLFERRMSVYEEIRDVIAKVLREGSCGTATFFEFVRAGDRLPMLFGDDVLAYFNKTKERLVQLDYFRSVKQLEREHELKLELSKFFDEFTPLVLPYVRMTQRLPKGL